MKVQRPVDSMRPPGGPAAERQINLRRPAPPPRYQLDLRHPASRPEERFFEFLPAEAPVLRAAGPMSAPQGRWARLRRYLRSILAVAALAGIGAFAAATHPQAGSGVVPVPRPLLPPGRGGVAGLPSAGASGWLGQLLANMSGRSLGDGAVLTAHPAAQAGGAGGLRSVAAPAQAPPTPAATPQPGSAPMPKSSSVAAPAPAPSATPISAPEPSSSPAPAATSGTASTLESAVQSVSGVLPQF